MICFYHRIDLDGHASGAIVKQKYPECQMIGVDYEDNISTLASMGTIAMEPGETVFVVDFSFGDLDMHFLKENFDLIWIDHHKSALERLAGFRCDGYRQIGKAGCELTWEYLYPGKPIPDAVKLLSNYDIWNHEDPRVLPFQYGMRSFDDTMPDNPNWQEILDQRFDVEPIVKRGEIILNYETKQNEIYAKGMSFESIFEGYRAICINKAFSNSKIFDSVYDPNLHDIMILFGYRAGKYKISLYAAKPEIDVSELAERFGGGGHKSASGMTVDFLPFIIYDQKEVA